MSALAISEERASTLSQLTELLQAQSCVIGLVLVGSGVTGFKDSFSDIDLVIVLEDDCAFASTYATLKELLLKTLNVAYHFETRTTSEDALLLMMLNNYLEIDMHFSKKRALAIKDKAWKILYAPKDDIQEAVDRSFSETLLIAPRRIYLQVVERVWQPILDCVTAINRNETWKALYMLEQIRNQTVQLAGINHRVETSSYNDVDKLPEMFLINLRHTIPTSTSNVAIRRALRSTVMMFFSEAIALEHLLKLDIAQQMQVKLMPYIEAYS